MLPLDELKDLNCYKTNVSSIIEITFCLGGESFRWQFKSWKEAPDPVFFVKMNHLLEDLTDKKLMYAQERSNVLITFVSQENALLINKLFHISQMCIRDRYRSLQAKLCAIMDPEKDSLRFYSLGKQYESKMESFGRTDDYRPEDTLMI